MKISLAEPIQMNQRIQQRNSLKQNKNLPDIADI